MGFRPAPHRHATPPQPTNSSPQRRDLAAVPSSSHCILALASRPHELLAAPRPRHPATPLHPASSSPLPPRLLCPLAQS
uniref:Uncharacterized protein n=1 Tax=Arundo donax TaxID=35708 RepID=A0A0A9AW38_ARUDO